MEADRGPCGGLRREACGPSPPKPNGQAGGCTEGPMAFENVWDALYLCSRLMCHTAVIARVGGLLK